MEKQKTPENQGFVLISLLIVVAIIAIVAAIYFKGSGNGQKNVIQTGNNAMEQTRENNALMQTEGQQNQDMLNSLDAPPANEHGALNQARSAAELQNNQNNSGY